MARICRRGMAFAAACGGPRAPLVPWFPADRLTRRSTVQDWPSAGRCLVRARTGS
jgi:hypothetical protein